MLLIGYVIVFVLLPTGVELSARARGFRWPAVVGLVAAELLGVLIVGAGLLSLAFNGSIQDYGEQPARTLGTAVPLITAGGVVSLMPWPIALLRRPH
jgi:hypothetical protein